MKLSKTFVYKLFILLFLYIILNILRFYINSAICPITITFTTLSTNSDSCICSPTCDVVDVDMEYVASSVWIPYPENVVPLSASTQFEIMEICDRYEISYDLILGMIYTESRFNLKAVGDSGNSFGAMQIQPKYWSDFANELSLSIYEPLDNIEIGCAILVKLLNLNNGDIVKALKQYNSGDPNYPSNQYVDSVFGYMDYLSREGGVNNETAKETNLCD